MVMMDDLSEIYSPAFFEEWGPGNKPYVDSAREISAELVRRLSPRRIVDVGCGCGVYGHFFREHGVEVIDLDGVLPPKEHSFTQDVVLRDLTEPFENDWGCFDFALCLEVAEHIPETYTDVFLDNLVKFSGRLVFSAAPPNQGGRHHVNERPKRYWVERLARRGFLYDRPATGELLEHFKRMKTPHMWMCQQLSIYERGSRPPDRGGLPLVGPPQPMDR